MTRRISRRANKQLRRWFFASELKHELKRDVRRLQMEQLECRALMASDLFATSLLLAGATTSDTGSNVGFTGEVGETPNVANANPIQSAWWNWTAPISAPVTIDTKGSNFDTNLGVYTGNAVNALSQVAADDDSGGNSTSLVTFFANAGTNYKISVDGFGAATGNIKLSLTQANDLFANATALTGLVDSDTGNNTAFTSETGEPSNTGNSTPVQSAWWRWTAPITGTVQIDTIGSNFDTTLGVYTGNSANSLTPVASNDNDAFTGSSRSRVIFTATAGTTYSISVDGAGSDTGSIKVNVKMSVQPTIVINGDANNNNLEITALGADHGYYQVDGGSPEVFSQNTLFVYNGGLGNDTLKINNPAGGLFAPTNGIMYAGGGQSGDALQNLGGAATGGSYSVGGTPDTGIVRHTSAGGTQVITFSGLAPALDTVVEPLFTINASNADNAINYTQGSVATNGLVTIDNFESMEFTNKSALTINALAGNDTINLNNPNVPTGLTGDADGNGANGNQPISVNGGDPSDSDTLITNGRAGSLEGIALRPFSQGAGMVTGTSVAIAYTGMKAVTIAGQAADNDQFNVDGTAGNDQFVFYPGLTADTGNVTGTMNQAGASFTLPSITVSGMTIAGGGLFFNVNLSGGTDTLVYHGTTGNDNISVGDVVAGGASIKNTVNGQPFNLLSLGSRIANVVVEAEDGDDTISVAGNVPAAVSVAVHGGNPDSGSDVLNFTGTVAAVSVDLGAATINQTGFGVVSYTGIETMNVDAASQPLKVSGTAQNDTLVVTPSTTANTVTVQANGQSPVVNATTSNTFLTVAGGPGSADQIVYNGTAINDTIGVNATTISHTGFKTITFDITTENILINGNAGNDAVTVAGAVVGLTVDGGSGNDTISGSTATGGFVAIGSDGDDTLTGGSGNDRLDGGAGLDIISGGTGTNTLLGGDDADIINSSGQNDVVDAGAGVDATNVTGAAGIYVVNTFFGTLVSVNGPSGGAQVAGSEELYVLPQVVAASTFTVNDLTGTDVKELGLSGQRSSGTSVSFNGLNGTATLNGTGQDDTISVAREEFGTLTTAFMPWGRVNMLAGTTTSLVINGDDGNDDISVAPNSFFQQPLAGLTLDGGEGNDVLAGADLEIGGNGNDVLKGSSGNDTLNGGDGNDTYIPLGGTDTIIDSSGQDVIVVDGTAGSDTINIGLAAGGTDLVVTVNGVSTTYPAIAGAGIDRITVNGLDGADALTVNSLNGTIPVPITFDGGNASDSLTLTGGTAGSNGYIPGPNPGQGTSTIIIAGVTQTVSFINVEPVTDNVAGSMSVNGTSADNAIDVVGGIVAIDNYPLLFLNNKTNLNINAGAGNDTINVTTPLGVSGQLNIFGNDPSAGDKLIVNGLNAVDTINFAPTSPDAGRVTVNGQIIAFQTIEQVLINGQGGNDNLTYASPGPDSALTFTPGATVNSGRVDGRAPGGSGGGAYAPLNYTNIARNGSLIFTNAVGPTDTLIYNGTSQDDVFSIGATPGVITLGTRTTGAFLAIPVVTTSISSLFISSQDGDDVINAVGPLPYANLVIEAGNPSASDVMNLSGATGPVTVNFGAGTVTGFGGVVTLSGVEVLNLNAGGNTVTVIGTPGDDVLDVSPTSTTSGTLALTSSQPFVGGTPVLNFSNASSLLTSLGGGDDKLITRYSSNPDTINIDVQGGKVTSPGFIDINFTGVDSIAAYGNEGDDTFNVTPLQPSAIANVVNGNFETGTFAGWTQFVTTPDGTAGGGGLPAVVPFDVDGNGTTNFAAKFAAGDANGPTLTPDQGGGIFQSVNLTNGFLTVSANVATEYAPPGVGSTDGGLFELLVDGNVVASHQFGAVFAGSVQRATLSGTVPAVTAGSHEIRVRITRDDFAQFSDTFQYVDDIQLGGSATLLPALQQTIPVFIDGGDPIGSTPGDTINIINNMGVMVGYEQGPENDEGSFTFRPGDERVSFDHIEHAGPIVNSPGLLIKGTNADDDITIIARDASYIQPGNPVPAGLDGIRDFTVSINGGLEILYIDVGGPDVAPAPSITGSLYVDGLAGDDDIVLRAPAPNGANWSMDVRVAGGTPSAVTGDQGDVFELETPGQNTVRYTPTGSDSGIVLIDTNANDVFGVGDTRITLGTFTNAFPSSPTANNGYNSSPGGIETLIYDGEGANDQLTIVGDSGLGAQAPQADRFVHTPGAAPDGGRIDDINLTSSTTLLGINYQNLGLGGGVRVDGLSGNDTLVALGTDGSDQIDLSFGAVANQATVGLSTALGSHVLLTTTGVANYELRTLEGDDTFNLNGAMRATGTIGIFAGGPTASDVVNFNGSGAGTVTTNLSTSTVQEAGFAPVLLSDVEILNANAATASATLLGTAGNDTIDVTPTGTDAVTFRLTSSNPDVGSTPVVNFSNVGATMSLDGGGGFNGLVLHGTDRPDVFDLDRGPLTLSLAGTQAITTTNSFFSWTVEGGNSGFAPDIFNINELSGAIASVQVVIHASPFVGDLLNYNTGFPQTYTPGSTRDSGEFSGGSSVSFTGLETANVTYSQLPTIATVNAGSGANQITATGTAPNSVSTTVDNNTVVNWVGLTTLQLNGGAGDDTIAVTPGAFTGAGGINVAGGDPTASDSLVITGTAGVDTVTFTPTSANSGALTGLASAVDFSTTEHVTYNGLTGADNLTIVGTAGDDTTSVTPTLGTGNFSAALSPTFNFSSVPNTTVNGGSNGFDIVTINGTAGIDTVTSAASAITVNGTGTLTIGTNMDRADVSTGDGDDNITLTAFTALPTQIFAGIGNDTIFGSPQVDVIYGGSGNDIIVGGAGNDTEYGEDGNDIFGNPNLAANGVADDSGSDFAFGGDGFDNFVWEPGDGADINNGGDDAADIFRFFGNAGPNDFVLRSGGTATHFNALIGAVNIDNHGIEDVIVDGQGGLDTFLVNDLYATEVVSINLALGAAGSVNPVTINGRNTADNVVISAGANPGEVNVQGLRYSVNISQAEVIDSLTFNGNNGDDQITVGSGANAVLSLNLNGNEGNDIVNAGATLASPTTAISINGNDGNDTLIGGGDDDRMDGGAGDDTFIGNGGTDAIGGGAGNSVGDTILLPGTAGNDVFTLALDASGFLLATINGVTTTYTNFLAGPIATSGIEQILVNGLAGTDTLTVNSANGAISIPINFDGGLDADLLTLTGGTATSDVYAPGPSPGQGSSTIVIGGVTQVVTFTNLEPVIDLVGGPLTVTANNADNAINYTQGSVAANGLVSIDSLETIEFSNKTSLTINALAGSDRINLNNPNVPTGLVIANGITVNAGDPTDSDTLVINGRAGVQDQMRLLPTGVGAGTITSTAPTTFFTGIENINVVLDPAASDYFTVDGTTGNDQFRITSGANIGQMYIDGTMNQGGVGAAFELPSINVTGQSNSSIGTFNFNGVGGSDTFKITGTDRNDTFTFTRSSATSGSVNHLVDGVQTNFIGFANLAVVTVDSLTGDDTFNVPTDFPFATNLNAGDPSASDVLNLTGSSTVANDIIVNLGAATVQEATFPAVTYTGVETLNLNAAAHNAIVVGTTGDDNLSVTPTGAATATITLTGSAPAVGATPTVNASNLGATFTVDLATGVDKLTVNGSQNGETIAVTGAAVAVGVLKTVTYLGAEALAVNGQAGSDTFNVTPSATTAIFVDGGDPIGVLPGDTLAITATGGAVAFTAGPESDEGGFVVTGGANPGSISYDHIESISPITGAVSATINGTNGDDDITIIARDSSTHAGTDGVQDFTVSVNAGPDILFVNTPTLTVDAKNGDDHIALRTPAPNNAVWNVQLALVGGSPSAGGVDSDLLTIDTPGTNTVNYTPTSANSGVFVLNQATASTVVLTGIERLAYDGEGGDDTFTIVGTANSDTITHTPGVANNQGNFRVNNLLAIDYQNLGAASTLTVDGLAAADTLVVAGTQDNDTFTVATTGAVTLGGRLAVSETNVEGLVLTGLDGDDTFNIPGNHPYSAGISIQAGNPSASDVVNFTASATVANDVTVNFGASTVQEATFGAVTLSSVELLNVNASGHTNTSVLGTTGNDNFSVTPTAADAVTTRLISSDPGVGGTPVVNVSGLGTTFTVDGAAGVDALTVNGTSVGDTISVIKGATTTIQVNALKVISLPSAGDEDLTVAAGDGNDTINVSGTTTNGQLLSINGGSPTSNAGAASDTLTVTMATAGNTTVSAGATPDAGAILSLDGTISFSGLELITVTGNGAVGNTITTTGTHDNDTIALQNIGGVNRVWINDRAVVSFANYQTVNLNGLFGDDSFSVAPSNLALVTDVNVNGGDPTASDTVTITGTTGVDNVTIDNLTLDGARISGLGPTVTVATTEHLLYSGQGGNDALTVTTPAGGQVITLTPGALAGEGSIALRNFNAGSGSPLLPIGFTGINASGTLSFTDFGGTRVDDLTINGTAESNIFGVSATGVVTLESQSAANTTSTRLLTTSTPGVAFLELLGLDGDDTFNVVGNHPFAAPGGLLIDGGNPSASDVLNFTATAASTVNYGSSTVSQTGSGPVNFTGLEIINLNATGNALSVLGAAGDDSMTVTVGSASTGQVKDGISLTRLGEAPTQVILPVLNYAGITGSLSVDLGAGEDRLAVVGNALSQTFNINDSEAPFVIDLPGGYGPVNVPANTVQVDDGNNESIDGAVTWLNLEALQVSGLEGNDTFHVIPVAGPATPAPGTSIPIFIDGGDPIGTTAGDRIVAFGNGNPVMVETGPENDEGGIVYGNPERVSFDHIEAITVVQPTSVIIVGTGSDDDITVIARDFQATDNPAYPGSDGTRDFTVQVNQGLEVLYLDVGGADPGPGITVIGQLHIDGLGGDDDITIRARARNLAPWSMLVEVAGGPPSDGADNEGDRLVLETPGQDTVYYTPTGSDTGVVLMDQNANATFEAGDTQIVMGPFVDADPPIAYDSSPGGIELFEYDGEGANDSFTIVGTAGNDTIVHTPGIGTDEGTLRVNNLLGVSYQNLGAAGSLTANGGTNGTDTLVYDGTTLGDTFTVAPTTGTIDLTNSHGNRLDLAQIGVERLALEGFAGDDIFNIPGNHPYSGGITVNAAEPSASDVLNFTASATVANAITANYGTATVQEATFGAVTYSGVELINLNAAGHSSTTVTGTTGNDNIAVTPTATAAATVQLLSSAPSIGATPVINATTLGTTFTVDAAAGADKVTVNGTTADDTIAVIKGATTTVQVNSLQIVSLPSASDENLTIAANDGVDTINVSGTANNAQILNVFGGIPNSNAGTSSDLLNITLPTAGLTRVLPGPASDEGAVETPDGNVNFGGIDFINVAGAAAGANTINAQGTNGNDTIALQLLGGANRFWVNDRAVVTFSNFPTVNLNGQFGDDTFSVSPVGLIGVNAINVNGGDPTASDTLIINGAVAANDVIGYNPTGPDAGSVTITGSATTTFTTVEALTINGRGAAAGGGDTLTVTTPAGADQVTLTPGSAFDSGSVTFTTANQPVNSSLTPLTFSNLGTTAGASLTFADAAARSDTFIYNGTQASDTFTVTATAVITLNSQIPVNIPGVSALRLLGLDGDDTFSMTGSAAGLPFTTLLDGGNPSASDVVNLTGNGTTAVTAQIGNADGTAVVSGGGLNTVTLTGDELANVNAATQNFSVTTTADSDTLVVTPTGTNSATLRANNVSPTVNASNIGTFSVDLLAGSDQLQVNGTQGVDAITVTSALVTVNPTIGGPLETVNYSNTEDLRVIGLAGNDTITVTPTTTTTTVFVDGGDPIGSTPGDRLVVNPPAGAFSVEPGPESDEGGLNFAAAGRLSFDHIEALTINGGAGVGPALILGTGADDDLTIIARDASTHAGADGAQDFTVNVNAGPEILFLNTPTLFVDAGAGDDDIVVREPAPNTALWNVQITVAGGPAASATGSQGDVFQLETPGTQTVTFTPTGVDTGTLTDTTNTSVFSLVNTFSIPTLGFVSQPGGVEQVIYQGLAGGDTLTINGTANNDTYVINPTGTGSGTFTSSLSPAFSFVGATAITVDGGANGTADSVEIQGTLGPDTVTSNATTVTLVGTVTLGAGLDQLYVNTYDGNDNIDLDLTSATLAKTVNSGAGNDIVNLSGSVDATIYGDDGDDLLIGSPNADLIFGGNGNDRIIGGAGDDTEYGEAGNDVFGDPVFVLASATVVGVPSNGLADDAGNDRLFGGDGSDVFLWDNGDNSDTVEGGAGESDVHVFQSAAAADQFTLSAINSTRMLLNRIGGGVNIDMASVEQVNVLGAGGGDTFTVGDLFPTELKVLNLDLGPADAAQDFVTLNGRNVADSVSILSPAAGALAVTGLRYDVNLSSIALADNDDFTFNANDGNDLVKTADDLSALFVSSNILANNHFTIDGGAGDDNLSSYGRLLGGDGNDTLTGFTSATLTNFAQIIDGGNGNDLLTGGTGLDALSGGAGDDTFVPGYDLQNDTIDGGTGFDAILVTGSLANDRIDLIQDSPTQLRYNLQGINGGTGVVGGAGTETDVLASGTVEEVKVLGLAGDDQIRVTQSDSLIANSQQALSLRFTVDAGQPGASDRLTVSDNGLGDTTIQRVGAQPGTGSYQIGSLAPVVYYDVEFTSLITTDANNVAVPSNPITGGYGTDGQGRLYVFKADPNESNNTLLNATYLGTGPTINVDPTIDPGFDVPFGAPGDEDWYRVVAQSTGDLDIRVFFQQQPVLANGRAGLPGNGNLDIAVYDIDGIITGFPTGGAIAGVGTFGTNEPTATTNDADERVRIPVVAGQTYYLRVRGAPTAAPLTNANGATASDSLAVNVYSLSVINTPVAKPYDGEVDDIIALSTVTGAPSDVQISGGATLSAIDDFYNGKDVYFTSGPLNGQRGRVLDYVGATKTFIFAANTFTTAPAVGDGFQVESFDTGRSQLDNITRDNTPIIRFRLDDAWLLQDVPGNPVGGNQLDPNNGIISIPFSGNSAAQRETTSLTGINAGFRVAIFDEGTPQQPGQLPQQPIGYARQIAEGVYEFDFERDRIVNGVATPFALTDGSHFLSARVQMVDPSSPNAGGFGDRSQSLEIVVDTVVPPAFFGLPNVDNDGLLPDSDTGVNANPETLNDRVTSDTTPGFFGQAEADSVIRLFVDLKADGTTNPDGTGDGIFEPDVDFQVGFTTAQPYDGTNQYPVGYWQIDAINFNLNAAPFPRDGQRTLFLTAEDVAGNINPVNGVIRLDIFLDTQGPQVTDVTINSTAALVGLTNNNELVKFNSNAPNTITDTIAVTNLAVGFKLQALDVLPVPTTPFPAGTLFGFATNGGSGRVYSINPNTGFATPVGSAFAVTSSTGYDIDFNPTNGLLRIVNSSNSNIAFNVATGTATNQTALTAGADVVGAAYDRNDSDPNSATTLFDIDFTTDTLVRQGDVNGTPNSPATGIITTVGALGVNTDANVGFDIARGTNFAFAALHDVVANSSGLYTLNLATGAASLVGAIGDGSTIISLAVLPAYDLFDPKPSTDGPTPPVNSLVISFQDLPARTQAFLIEALKEDVADSPGLYVVRGDQNGIIPIYQIIVTNQPVLAGEPALATVELVFRLAGPDGVYNTSDDIGAPLPDDRYTLTVDDDIIDKAGNHLDGESNAAEPQEFPSFPSGDNLNGGDFIARFTIDSRPEIGNYGAGVAYVDINGNNFIDPQGDDNDFTNRDLVFQVGTISDGLFAGKFEPFAPSLNDNDGFDKLGAYGYDNIAKKYRFLLDFDHDGVSDLSVISAFQVNAIAVAGDFAPNHPGDEIGLFDGTAWYLDNVGDNQLHVKIASNFNGRPIVGDFNGDGSDDLATYDAGTNIFYFDTNRDGIADDQLAIGGPINGYTEIPVAGDLNLDGIDDLGLWVPDRQGSPTPTTAEWFFLVSDRIGQTLPSDTFDKYAPTPLGNDIFAQFGDHFTLPIFGNFDPPTTPKPVSEQNVLNPLDVDNDGEITATDVITVINRINSGEKRVSTSSLFRGPYVDVDGDKVVSASDVIRIINHINANPTISSNSEGEATDSLFAEGEFSSSNLNDDLLNLLVADSLSTTKKK